MSYPVSRIGDTSDHGGSIITGSTNFGVDGMPVARVGDILDCPQHGKNPIVTSMVVQTQDDGKPLAHIGSKTQCGATIT
ncbi:PAAR domain-containing protein [Hydromonas duriensis]|uniref:Putative Zn-binding protein involved in type VI secretion n=1 Tax=Hydromonas duriensis TaxID=1527608 RepID=A0A4R6Y4S9_9BURK|nr:PAAR domain-containing protein [Hydromonas duriensis]TDR29100.1 putative Zn-binding protein involved in type VI secretion [Hydromonas duriensis]